MRLGMVVTDLDGTLLDSGRRVAPRDRATLLELGALDVVRVVATGRSIFSAYQVLGLDLPIDFLVHSSGAGIVNWPARETVRVQHMSPAAARALATCLSDRGLDFMLHRAIPDNHRCFFHRTGRPNADFERRRQAYAAHMESLRFPLCIEEAMCQAVVIEPPPGPGCYAELLRELCGFSVIRATSPFDHASTWVEVFPSGVCKSAAASWLFSRHAPRGSQSLAVGNDYNDVDLLDWADLPCVVGNAPSELRSRYPSVASNDAGGFTEAVQRALGR